MKFLERWIGRIVDLVLSAIEKRTGATTPREEAPPVQPRTPANGSWDPDKTDPNYPKRKGP